MLHLMTSISHLIPRSLRPCAQSTYTRTRTYYTSSSDVHVHVLTRTNILVYSQCPGCASRAAPTDARCGCAEWCADGVTGAWNQTSSVNQVDRPSPRPSTASNTLKRTSPRANTSNSSSQRYKCRFLFTSFIPCVDIDTFQVKINDNVGGTWHHRKPLVLVFICIVFSWMPVDVM